MALLSQASRLYLPDVRSEGPSADASEPSQEARRVPASDSEADWESGDGVITGAQRQKFVVPYRFRRLANHKSGVASRNRCIARWRQRRFKFKVQKGGLSCR